MPIIIQNHVLTGYEEPDEEFVIIPEDVTQIQESAFYGHAGVKKILIPAGLEKIDAGAFGACENLEEISVPDENPYYTSIDGILYDKAVTRLICCPGAKQSVVIPEGVKSIDVGAFWFCVYLTEVTLPESLTKIGASAFSGCFQLESIRIPDGVTEIGSRAFCDCRNLKEIFLPANLKSIQMMTFHKCFQLERVHVSDSISVIENLAFAQCEKLKSFSFPENLTEIGEQAFTRCSALERVILPGKLRTISTNAFYLCENLREVIIPESVETIGRGAIFKENSFFSTMNGKKLEDTMVKLTFLVNGQKLWVPLLKEWGDEEQWLLEFVRNPDDAHFDKLADTHKSAAAEACWECGEHIKAYLGEHIQDAVQGALYWNHPEELAHLLKSRLVTREHISYLMEYAMKMTELTGNAECQVMLMRYQSEQLSFSSEEDIKKKFDLS